jgi:carbonic anhydrase
METHWKSYAPKIHHMPKPNEWSIDNDTKPIEPHFCRKQRGEPKKLRCRGPEENEPQENVS